MRSARHGTLATLVVLCSALLAASGCEVAFSSFQAEARDEWTKSFQASAGVRLEIDNTNGSIEVDPSTDGQIHVRAERVAKAATDQAAKDLLKKIEIREAVDSVAVRLETRSPSSGFLSGGQTKVSYFIKVPASVEARLQNTNGGITLRDLGGPVDAAVGRGGIEGRGLRGALEAGTTNGGINVDVSAIAEKGVSLETTNGGIRLTLPEDAKADITASVVNGAVDVSGLKAEASGESSRRRFEGRLNGGGPRVTAETVNGGVKISSSQKP